MARRRRRQRTPAEREQRRAQLLDAVETALRAEGPSASMESMATAAGVTKPILYKHFGSKDGVADALAERWVNRLGEGLESALTATNDPREQVEATIRAYLGFIDEHPEIYRFLLDEARQGARRTVEDFASKLILRLMFVLAVQFQRHGVDAAQAEPFAHALVGMVRQVSDWWLHAEAQPPLDEVAELLSQLAWHGLAGLPLDSPAPVA
ncbi:MAG: TetR/AcrR family transcriptional regulator [Nitriliruptorales bacterium]|nr:TetR/AcrR family transcriptional regulator [Nitriliruptorales bacterium]